jgi:hypothetical protein
VISEATGASPRRHFRGEFAKWKFTFLVPDGTRGVPLFTSFELYRRFQDDRYFQTRVGGTLANPSGLA